MLIYYRGSGVIANVALVVNIILIAGGLAAFNATLTLPGIAGIILTIGMAVDANVLIFERIREELRLGKTALAAVDAGFERATLTILDANVTTLIAALVLFQFGSGPVKGFAVTLSLGVVSSLFTALILSRAIFEFFLVQRRVKRLSI
jgi:preprotein translocase subunit SecD